MLSGLEVLQRRVTRRGPARLRGDQPHLSAGSRCPPAMRSTFSAGSAGRHRARPQDHSRERPLTPPRAPRIGSVEPVSSGPTSGRESHAHDHPRGASRRPRPAARRAPSRGERQLRDAARHPRGGRRRAAGVPPARAQRAAGAPRPGRGGPRDAFVGPGHAQEPAARLHPVAALAGAPAVRTTCPPDLVVLHTSTPRDGKVSLGIEVNILPAAIEAARARGGIVIAQMNPRMPYTFGDAEISVDARPRPRGRRADLDPRRAPAIDDISAAIGDRVATRVGRRGDAAARHRRGARRRPRRPDGAPRPAGLVGDVQRRRPRAASAPARSTAAIPLTRSFLFGSPELYAWVDRNPRVGMLRTETTNDPALIAAQPG